MSIKFNRIILAGNSFCVTLPKEWVRKNSVKKGDYVAVSETKTGLLIELVEKKDDDETNS